MSGGDERGRMSLPEAAGLLSLPVESIEALVGAGYLRTTPSAGRSEVRARRPQGLPRPQRRG